MATLNAKNVIFALFIAAIVFFDAAISAHAVSTFITQQGGTGTTSPSGILYGDNSATTHVNTVVIGTGLSFSGGTLSNTGATFAFPFTPNSWGNSTSTVIGFPGIIVTGSSTFSGLLTGALYSQNGLLLSHATSSSVVASQDVWRDANSNIFANNFVPNLTSTVSSGGTVVLTPASSRYQLLTGSSNHTYQMPNGNASGMNTGATWEFNNNSTGVLHVQTHGGAFIADVPAGGWDKVVLFDNGTSEGSWETHALLGHFNVSQSNGLGLGTSTPYAQLSIHANAAASVIYKTLFAIGSSTASATSTLFSVDNTGLASTTNLIVSGLGSSGTTCVQASASGQLSSTGSACGSGGGGGSDPFTHAQQGMSATTTAIGIGTTTPFSQLSVSTSTQSSPFTKLFTVASTTGAEILSVLGNGNVGIGTSTPSNPLSVQGNSILGGYTLVGTTSPLGGTSGVFLQEGGTDNSINGIQEGTFNNSPGTRAYACKFLNNDRATPAVLNFSAWCLNSGNYSDTTFGTGLANPGQAILQNTEGRLTLVSSSTTEPVINFLTGGTASSNEVARFNTTGLGIGSTSPLAQLSIQSLYTSSSTPLFQANIIGSSTPALYIGSPNQKGYIGIGSTSPSSNLTVAANENNTTGNTLSLINTDAVGDSPATLEFGTLYSGGTTRNYSHIVSRVNSTDSSPLLDFYLNSQTPKTFGTKIAEFGPTVTQVYGTSFYFASTAPSATGFSPTNPVFTATYAGNGATGISVTGNTAASGAAIAVTSSGTNENLTINAKGSGTVTINNTATGNISLSRATTISTSVNVPLVMGGTSAAGTLTVEGTNATAPTTASLTLRGAGNATNPSETFTINGIGFGTTTPRFTLQSSVSSTSQLVIDDASATSNKFGFRAINNYLAIATISPTTFATATVPILAFTQDGFVGIGTSTPGTFFSVDGVLNAARSGLITFLGEIVGKDMTNGTVGRISPTRSFVLSTATTTSWQGTTSPAYSPSLVMPFAGTLQQVRCLASTTQAFLGVQTLINTSAPTPSYFVASNTVGVEHFSASNTFSAGDRIMAFFGTSTDANATSITCTYDVTETP